ncbi:MAG: preprotein translocase subunit SecG [Pseudomonadota bacterium]|nr:preprotein translocase subunit SecG [Pseudomonadota bacterium]
MQTILTVSHLFLALGLVGLVLMQHGKGADAGAAFGSGASATVFGARGSGSFLSRTTALLAALFFATSMALAYFAAQVGEPEGLMEGVEVPAAPAAVEVQEETLAVPAPPAAAERTDVPSVPGRAVPADAAAPEVPVPVVEQTEAVPVPETTPVPVEVPLPASE